MCMSGGLSMDLSKAQTDKKSPTKRELAAFHSNEAKRLAREALEEENDESALAAEYGPRLR